MDKYPSLTYDKPIQVVKHDIDHFIDTAGQKPLYCKPRPLSNEARTMAQDAFQKLVEDGIIIRACLGWCSPLNFVLKPDKSRRPVGDDINDICCSSGIMQGRQLSPMLYDAYTDDLKHNFQAIGVGCYVGGAWVNSLSYELTWCYLHPI